MTRVELIHDLYRASRPSARCPHLAHDAAAGCFCTSPEVTAPEPARFSVCDPYSLQLWCLDGPERWEKCIFFPKALTPV